MRSLVLSLFVLIAALFFSASTASAQVLGLIQDDYERYKQLFRTGKDPNLSHHPTEGSSRWRALYRNHQWKAYAEATEFREPSLAAQILMGIYLASFVDHELTYQIDSVVLHKAHFSNAMAEYITLNRLGTYLQNKKPLEEAGATSAARMGAQLLDSSGMGSGMGGGGMEGSSAGGGGMGGAGGAEGSTAMQFYSPDELARMQRLGNNIHEAARKRMVSGRQITRRQNAEIRSVQNLFHRESNGWAAIYASMREKFIILDNLADSFTFNWDEVKREEELNKLIESDKVKRIADERVDSRIANNNSMMDGSGGAMAMDSSMGMPMDSSMGGMDMAYGGMPMGGAGMGMGGPRYSEEDIAKMREKEPAVVAEEMLKDLEAQEAAFKYIVGVYEGSDYHLATLRTIRRYLQAGADRGDPIAQYHLALFLRYLGEFIDEEDVENKSQELLTKVAASDLPKSRSEELNTYFVWESENEEKRTANMQIKFDALKKQEKEKMDMIEEILIIVEDQIGTIESNSGTGGTGGAGGQGGGSGGTGGGSGG